MTTRMTLSLATCLAVSLAVGCQNPRGIVRGQAPNEARFAPTSHAGMHDGEHEPRGAFHGGHYHTFEYKTPENLSYPAANQPPAVVQYPYYTLRGPTDFFQK